ncbi:WD40-repeat-containing domain protein [Geopyxis carbonaria]|nr:WD40-repeat-containing domain protein [Geopyxis carbonaria]
MAWQSPSAHNAPDGSGNSGVPGQNGNGNGNGGPIGVEYTLQGVMRFLQTEWNKHERDRNNWEIERAEMKARIAKLEGEHRAQKRLHQVYLARISILEKALKKERTDRAIEEGKTPQEIEADERARAEMEQLKAAEKRKHFGESGALYNAESGRNKSRAYLEKCLQEITYLLSPPNHPAPQQPPVANMDAVFPQQHQQQQQALEQALFQQQQQQLQQLQQLQQQKQQQQNMHHSLNPSPSPNHQPPPPPPNEVPQSHPMRSHSLRSQGTPFQENRPQPQPQITVPSMSSRESAEKIPSPLNAYGSQRNEFPRKETNPFADAAMNMNSEPTDTSNDDSWDFDDKPPAASDTDPTSASNSLPDEMTDYGSANHKSNNIHSQRRKLSLSSKRRQASREQSNSTKSDAGNFKVKFAMRGHLDVIRAVVFTGGGSLNEPEICTTGDDGVLKRWFIPGNYGLSMGGITDVDVQSHFTHRGHQGIVTSLAACPGNPTDRTGEGWVFSGGQDSSVKVWEAGKVGCKATLEGHTDAVWAVCVLPSSAAMLGGGHSYERILLASGSADGTIKIWSVTPPPVPPRRPSSASSTGSVRSTFDSYTNNDTFDYSLISTITRPDITASPTCITPMSLTGETFIVSYNDASVIIYDTASGEEVVSMASQETYDGSPATGVTSVVSTTTSLDSGAEAGKEEDVLLAGATGQRGGLGGVVISGHEDQYVRIFDANSGQCTYTMLAHTAAISSLALSPDGRELVSAGHDASLRFWSMEKRSCTQEITTHRLMRGEGVCAVVWSDDGKWVVSGGGDGVVKVYCR